jgi:hypothetical protein
MSLSAASLQDIVDGLNSAPFNRTFTLISLSELRSQPGELHRLLVAVLREVAPDLPEVGQDAGDLALVLDEAIARLAGLKYKPSDPMPVFQDKLHSGDPNTILSILQYLLTNLDLCRKRAYLFRFLQPPQIPPEFSQDASLQEAAAQLRELQTEFKNVYRALEASRAGAAELEPVNARMALLAQSRDQLTQKTDALRNKLGVSGISADDLASMLRSLSEIRSAESGEAALAAKVAEQVAARDAAQLRADTARRRLVASRAAETVDDIEAIIKAATEEAATLSDRVSRVLPAAIAAKRDMLSSLSGTAAVPDRAVQSSLFAPAATDIGSLGQEGSGDLVSRAAQALGTAGRGRTAVSAAPPRSAEELVAATHHVTDETERALAKAAETRRETSEARLARQRAAAAPAEVSDASNVLATLRQLSAKQQQNLRLVSRKHAQLLKESQELDDQLDAAVPDPSGDGDGAPVTRLEFKRAQAAVKPLAVELRRKKNELAALANEYAVLRRTVAILSELAGAAPAADADIADEFASPAKAAEGRALLADLREAVAAQRAELEPSIRELREVRVRVSEAQERVAAAVEKRERTAAGREGELAKLRSEVAGAERDVNSLETELHRTKCDRLVVDAALARVATGPHFRAAKAALTEAVAEADAEARQLKARQRQIRTEGQALTRQRQAFEGLRALLMQKLQ